MSQFNTGDLALLRQALARNNNGGSIHWTKPQVNAALQAIEDGMQGGSNVGARTVPAYLGLAIETAAPGVFSAGEKSKLFAIWCLTAAVRLGVS